MVHIAVSEIQWRSFDHPQFEDLSRLNPGAQLLSDYMVESFCRMSIMFSLVSSLACHFSGSRSIHSAICEQCSTPVLMIKPYGLLWAYTLQIIPNHPFFTLFPFVVWMFTIHGLKLNAKIPKIPGSRFASATPPLGADLLAAVPSVLVNIVASGVQDGVGDRYHGDRWKWGIEVIEASVNMASYGHLKG